MLIKWFNLHSKDGKWFWKSQLVASCILQYWRKDQTLPVEIQS